ncbi:cytochrome P450 [Streptomyces albireticuli]|uniref:Cytochrome n=1 Tax=Streptomyces albireticuli TaxID=1940 RepID=A0A2A2D3Q6_9ACTN|nr:cytochrome P450 [Streptomyces albireticuli]MCD9144910.1 cytochrome P450 [Streptomyces albireticuli]MCD9164336.1 cytochrome P450 [Streptomyces albireticuli]MCD9194047.1 cytochrome P450 [Streptomyces albireticuli]PAU45942.1 cytochrome [Streptomyces albireticuli]
MTAPQAPASEESPHEAPLPHYPFSTRGDRLAPELHELRGRCPVARVSTNSGDEAWLVTGYELTQHVLRDRAFARSVLAEADSPGQDAPILAPELLDAMNHLQKAGLRDEVLKALGRNQPELPADWVEAMTREGLEAMVREGGPGDLQHHFAEWVAGQCMCRLLGLPFEDHAWLAVRADLDLTMVTPTHEELARNWEEIRVYMHEHMAARRPGEPRGLADRLADLNAAHQGLTDRQLSNIVSVLFVSGYEDFASFLGVAAFNLLQHPEVMSGLRDRPETMPQCVEELLRCSVVLGNAIPRFVTRDARLGSAEVKKGEMVLLSLDAVNYDTAAFADPEGFDPTRSPNPHLRFGYGRHHCPGAHLVRRQSDIAFRVLLDRLPGVRLAVPPSEVPWHPDRMAIMAAGIPVTW